MDDDRHRTGSVFLGELRSQLAELVAGIERCLRQLDDRQLWWRPTPTQNSIANLVLHLCGNLRQRIPSLLGGAPDVRNRPLEFTERGPIPREALLGRLAEALQAADQTLAELPPAALTDRKSYRGASRQFEESVAGCLLRTLVHLGGHAQEIVCLTRMQLGERYAFRGAPPPGTHPGPTE